MKKVKWTFLVALLVSTASLASSKAEQEAALNEILKGLHSDVEETVAAKYASKYVGLINVQLGELTRFKGLDCSVQIDLSSTGNVENVTLSNQNGLCRKVFNAVWEIGSFPLPSEAKEANKLRKLSLNINP
ncbi:cell envelope integrity protein TolA [Vibrio alginolyticus]|nr:cell envelope integrity protein TolA [Vibrio alginolyticus]ELB2891597.1 cell envelope integrity protein TolA [Vibrio alginolyticus]